MQTNHVTLAQTTAQRQQQRQRRYNDNAKTKRKPANVYAFSNFKYNETHKSNACQIFLVLSFELQRKNDDETQKF